MYYVKRCTYVKIKNAKTVVILSIVNCVDRHKEKDARRVALIWEKDEPGQEERVTYGLDFSIEYFAIIYCCDMFSDIVFL